MMIQKKGNKQSKSTRIACATALAAVVSAATPMWVNATEPDSNSGATPGVTPIVTPTPATTMDNSTEGKTMTPGHMDKSHKNPMSMDSTRMDHANMQGMSHTGDVDYDYAVNMRMHHQAAIDMSQLLLDSGKNPEMLSMARQIVSVHKQEITALDKWIAAHKQSSNPHH